MLRGFIYRQTTLGVHLYIPCQFSILMTCFGFKASIYEWNSFNDFILWIYFIHLIISCPMSCRASSRGQVEGIDCLSAQPKIGGATHLTSSLINYSIYTSLTLNNTKGKRKGCSPKIFIKKQSNMNWFKSQPAQINQHAEVKWTNSNPRGAIRRRRNDGDRIWKKSLSGETIRTCINNRASNKYIS